MALAHESLRSDRKLICAAGSAEAELIEAAAAADTGAAVAGRGGGGGRPHEVVVVVVVVVAVFVYESGGSLLQRRLPVTSRIRASHYLIVSSSTQNIKSIGGGHVCLN